MIVANTYDELGQLIGKGVGGRTAQRRLQTIDYGYNIRGWLKMINNPEAIGTDLFAFRLHYNDPASTTPALYNGNISQAYWKTANSDNSLKHYDYRYDALNRLTFATDNQDRYSENLSYDKNGNIMDLVRKGATNSNATAFGIMDQLTYHYDAGNKLLKVQDPAGDQGFKDGVNTGNDYTYDNNGNIISDANKGITSITYNHLNLPVEIISTAGAILYAYDATGVKLMKTVYDFNFESPLSITQYAGAYQYELVPGRDQQHILKFFSQPEGYVAYNNGTFSYIYHYKDHLGNNRLSYSDSNDDGQVTASEIIEEDNYYPFGLKHNGYNSVINGYNPSKYKFNGKELQDELGLNAYDYGARMYFPDAPRWAQIDPLAELNRRGSPYTYGKNNPVYFIDPDGMLDRSFIDDLWKKSGNETKWTNNNNGTFSGSNGATASSGEGTPPDDVTVGSNGRVTNVVRNDKPNRFFDQKGNQLKPNDPSFDNQYLSGSWKVGDQLFTPISISTFFNFIAKAGFMPISHFGIGHRYLLTAYQSHSAADFGYNQLMSAYNETYAGTEYSGNTGNGSFYRFEGTNTLYNLGDAGNFMWGGWMSFNNFSYGEVKFGSRMNSIFTLNGFDTDADQRAIKNGFNYMK
ncbi:MAG TPA: RHS repeat-associated core domain-containing protein [Flavobacterium sp.]|jgi:RHS repeat-associated protein